jgi:hypothetical protein
MAVFAVSITKSAQWRGQQEEFSNVYHLLTTPGQLFPDAEIIAELERLEKLVHSTEVTFRTGRTWGPTDLGPAESVTREIVDLSGAGSQTPGSSVYRECAVLVQWPLGRYGSRNRPQYLRKWLHTFGAALGYPPDGSTPISSPPLPTSSLGQYMAEVTVVNPSGLTDDFELCTADGRTPIAAAAPYPYFEHRQFRG